MHTILIWVILSYLCSVSSFCGLGRILWQPLRSSSGGFSDHQIRRALGLALHDWAPQQQRWHDAIDHAPMLCYTSCAPQRTLTCTMHVAGGSCALTCAFVRSYGAPSSTIQTSLCCDSSRCTSSSQTVLQCRSPPCIGTFSVHRRFQVASTQKGHELQATRNQHHHDRAKLSIHQPISYTKRTINAINR